MLDWVFDGIISWIGEHVNSLLDAVSGIMLDALGVDMTVMASYFPFLETAFTTMKYIGWALLLLMVIWQLFRAFAGPILEAENPWTVLARGTLSAFCIGYSKDIFNILIYIAKAPYEALQSVSVASYSFTDVYTFLQTSLQAAIVGVTLSSTIFTLLIIILILALGWNYIKLLLEVVERYIMVGILYFSSPLAFSTMGTKSTSNVFKAWCRMCGSELLLLVLNVWFIRGYNSGVTVLMLNGGVVPGRPATSAILCLFCLLAYLKIAQKFDAYLATLGLNTAQTGGNLGMEMLVMTRMVGSVVGHGGSLSGGGKSGSSASGSAGSTAPQGFGAKFRAAFSGETYRTNSIAEGPNNGIGGLNGWALNTLAARSIRNGHATDASTVSKIAHGSIAPKNGAFTGASADNSLPGYMPVFGGKQLSGTQISNGHISTAATSADGNTTGFEAFSASAFERPDGAFRTVTAADGSKWFVTANGEGASDFFAAPEAGTVLSGEDAAEFFPDDDSIKSLQSVGDGQMNAEYADGTTGKLYSSAQFDEPEAPHDIVTDSNGLDWYKMEPNANIGEIPDGSAPTESAEEIHSDAPAEANGVDSIPAAPAAEIATDGAAADNISDNTADPVMVTENQSEGISGPPITGSDNIPAAPVAETVTDGAAADYISDNAADPVMVTENQSEGISGPPITGSDNIPAAPVAETVTEGAAADYISDNAADPVMVTENQSEGISGPPITGFDNVPAAASDVSVLSEDGIRAPEAAGTVPVETAIPASEYIAGGTSGEQSSIAATGSFASFMPGYSGNVTNVDTSMRNDGQFTVYNADGTGTRFYDTTMYKPAGNYRMYEDRNGHSWLAYDGQYQNVHHVVTDEHGKPVTDSFGRAKERIEPEMTFRQTPQRIKAPQKKKSRDNKNPRRKNK